MSATDTLGNEGEKQKKANMRFSFYVADGAEIDEISKAVKSALVVERDSIGRDVCIEVGGVAGTCDRGTRVDFHVASKSHGKVDVDKALDVVEHVQGVSEAVFRIRGENVRATITGPHPKNGPKVK